MKILILFFLFNLLFIGNFLNAQNPRLIVPFDFNTNIQYADFSLDNKLILERSESNAKIWDAKTGLILRNIHNIQSCRFSNNKKFIITTSADKSAQILDSLGNPMIKLINYKNHSLNNTAQSLDDVFDGKFSHNDKKIATILGDNNVEIWDARSGNLDNILNGHSDAVNSISFLNNDSLLLTSSDDSSAILWNIKTGKLKLKLEGHLGSVTFSIASLDNKYALTSSTDKTVKLWDLKDGKILYDFKYSANHFGFSQDNKLFFISTAKKVRLFNVSDGKKISEISSNSYNEDVKFSADSKTIIIAADTAKFYDVQSCKFLHALNGNGITEVRYSSDGSKILICKGNILSIYDAFTFIKNKDIKANHYTSSLNYADFSSDNTMFTASFFTEKILNIHDKNIYNFNTDDLAIQYSTFSHDNSKLLVKTQKGELKIWDVKTKNLIYQFKDTSSKDDITHVKGATTIKFSSDDSKVFSFSYGLIKVWDLVSNKVEYLNKEFTAGVISVKFSNDDSKILLLSKDSSLKMFDTKSLKLLWQKKEDGPLRSAILDLSSDNKKVLYARGSLIKIVPISNELENLKIDVKSVDCGASFSPDGSEILVFDNSLRWFKTDNGKMRNQAFFNSDINSANYSVDGRKIIITNEQELNIFDNNSGSLLFTTYFLDSTDYLIVDKEYHYDGTEAARKLLYFTCGTEVISLDQVKDQLWVPNLAERIMKGESINARKLSDLDICNLTPQVEEIETKTASAGYHFKITPRRGGLGETVLYVNDIEVKRYKPLQLIKAGANYNLNLSQKELQQYFVLGQQNTVTVKSFTAKNDIASRGAKVTNTDTSKINSTPPNLYAVMVGVSEYKGGDLNLKYAAKDATDLSAAIGYSARKLLNTDGKEHVFTYNLTTSNDHYLLPEKRAIQQTLAEIGKKSAPNDILLVFFAGHGVTQGEKKKFYFLTSDASSASATDAPETVGISTSELTEWIQPSKIKAQKRILILDACNSGQAINDLVKIGDKQQNYVSARNDDKAEQIKAIDKLNERSGMFILAASASNQSAYEMGRYNQGLLTYALLKVMKEQPDILEDGKYLNVSRWFTAAEKTVTDIMRETGNRQQPQITSTTNFNIGIVDNEVASNIKLPVEKTTFKASVFLNADENINDDNLQISELVNQNLSDISNRGINSTISYIMGSNSPDSYSLSGRYIIKDNIITVKINIKQNNLIKQKFEAIGSKDQLIELSKQITEKATNLIKQ